MHRGTCFPAPVSEKKVLNASSDAPIVLSLGICPLFFKKSSVNEGRVSRSGQHEPPRYF